MAPNRRSGPNNENPDIAAIIAQQLQAILPQIVTQVTNNARSRRLTFVRKNDSEMYSLFESCEGVMWYGSGSMSELQRVNSRGFKNLFKRKGRFVRQPHDEKKSFQKKDDKKGNNDRKCFRCGDPNHLIGDCPKPPRNKNQKAFFKGSWCDSEEEDKQIND
ncbi:alpha/beta hydrolases superfamily protein [Tanacetum coccineum]|uniref:Alpha/beta hydrolases superfamily protein n=1 Tax=Tanacetum coccineum TaxID=301880 RepID=A0ABQ5GBZ9_9ASTR